MRLGLSFFPGWVFGFAVSYQYGCGVLVNLPFISVNIYKKRKKQVTLKYAQPVIEVGSTYDNHPHKQMLTIKYSDGTERQYVGSSTVWHAFPEFKRCSTSKELILSELYTKHEYYGFKNATEILE